MTTPRKPAAMTARQRQDWLVWAIRNRVPREQWAADLGITRDAVTRHLGTLHDAGRVTLVKTTGRNIVPVLEARG